MDGLYLKKNITRLALFAIIVFFIAITIMACICVMKLFYPPLSLSDFNEFITTIIAIFAFIITYYEYHMAKDAKQAQVFSEYNKRYSEDSNIVKVVKYLNYFDNDGEVNNPVPEKPSNYEVEMFMRFFEELDLQIVKNRLNKKDVYDLFLYYANKLKEGNYYSEFGVTDIEGINWTRFNRLMKEYNKYLEQKSVLQ